MTEVTVPVALIEALRNEYLTGHCPIKAGWGDSAPIEGLIGLLVPQDIRTVAGVQCRTCHREEIVNVDAAGTLLTHLTGWYYTTDTGWLCPDHAPQRTGDTS